MHIKEKIKKEEEIYWGTKEMIPSKQLFELNIETANLCHLQ